MDIIEMTRQLGKQIQEEECVKLFLETQKQTEKDDILQKLIGDFNLKRMELNAMLQKDPKDKDPHVLTELDAQLKGIYQSITEYPLMIRLNEQKQAVDAILNKINVLISSAVAGENLDEIDLDAVGCTGSCDSCAGCH